VGSLAQDSKGAVVGAVIEVLEEGDDATLAQPDEGSAEEVGWQLLSQQATQITLARERKSRSIQSFKKKFWSVVNRNFFLVQKLIWQDNWRSKNCLSRGKSSVFPWLHAKSEEYLG
jgi:hypothetical protein